MRVFRTFAALILTGHWGHTRVAVRFRTNTGCNHQARWDVSTGVSDLPPDPGQGPGRGFLDATLPHRDTVYRVARRLASDPGEAEDLVQETYLRAYAKFDQHTGDTRAWLVMICVNLARSAGRRRLRRPMLTFEAELDCVDGSLDVTEQVLARLDRDAVACALEQLPAEQRLAIVLMDIAGHTAAEVAQMLGCPRGTVLSRVHRGRRRLAQLLIRAGIRQ